MTQLTRQDGSPMALDAERAGDAAPSRFADYLTLSKPRITLMVVVTACIGFAFGASEGWTWLTLMGMIAGTALSCMGAAALNQVIERDTDARMQRTRHRPLPAGRRRVGEATLLGLILSVVGIACIWWTGNALAAALTAATVFSYTLIYTPLKRRTSLALLIGAVPGAAPPLIGYAAASGTLGLAAWLLFAIMFCWQVPHFLAIAWLYRDDFARANLPLLAVIDPDGARTFRQVLIGCLLLLPLGVLPAAAGISGMIYFATAMVCGIGFLVYGVKLVISPTREQARRLFLASLIYLPVVFAVMLIDKL